MTFPSREALCLVWREERGKCPYFDNGQHPLVGLRVGVDLETLAWVSIDDGVGSPPRACGGVVLVLNCQVDNNPHGSFLDGGLKLQTEQMVTVTIW